MSKWSLLRSSLNGRRDHDNEVSIHCFKGFNLINRKKILWKGLQLQFNVSSSSSDDNDDRSSSSIITIDTLHKMLSVCYDYMETMADTAEISVIIIALGNDITRLIDIINTGVTNDCFRIDFIKTGATTTTTTTNDDDNDIDSNDAWMLSRLYVKHKLLKPSMNACHYWSYSIPFTNNTSSSSSSSTSSSSSSSGSSSSSSSIITREKPEDASVSINGLLSNKKHGIDNTGNVRVWTSELLLLYILLQQHNKNNNNNNNNKRTVLELGGGNTGLCGLGLACTNWCESIVITDGHPDCVLNQNVCIQMNKQHGNISKDVSIHSHLLRWSENDVLGDWNLITLGGTKTFNVIIASDCLFFKDFHKDLLWVLNNSLSYDTDSCVYLLQPKRSGTMDMFLDIAKEYFNIIISNDYCQQVNDLHKHYLSTDTSYNTDIHLPILVTLTRK